VDSEAGIASERAGWHLDDLQASRSKEEPEVLKDGIYDFKISTSDADLFCFQDLAWIG
jgi:hypothetical protein